MKARLPILGSNISIINNPLGGIEEDRKRTSRQSRNMNRSSLHFDRLTGTKNEGNEISKLLKVQPIMKEKVTGVQN